MCVKSVFTGLVAALLAGAAAAAPGPAILPDKATQDKIRALLTERRDALREVLKGLEVQFEVGRLTTDVVLKAHRAVLETELELATTPAERVKVCEGLAKCSRDNEAHVKVLFDAGRVTSGELAGARAELRADEVRLLRERAGSRPTEKQAADLRKLRADYRELLTKAFEEQQKAFIDTGNVLPHVICRTARGKLEADLECAATPAERVAARRANLAAAKQRATVSKARFEAGKVTRYMHHTCVAEALAAEIDLLRAAGKLTPEEAGRVRALRRECRVEWGEVFRDPLRSDPPTISGRLLEADLGLSEKADERLAAHRAHLKRMRESEQAVKAQHDEGRLSALDYLHARAARLASEVAFLRAGGKPAELAK
jgi:hypothetical protein